MGPLRRALHGFDERHTQAAGLQLQDAVHRASGRCGHFILQQSRVRAGFEDHPSGSVHCLRGQLRRDVPGQANIDACLRQSLEDDVKEGRTRA